MVLVATSTPSLVAVRVAVACVVGMAGEQCQVATQHHMPAIRHSKLRVCKQGGQ